MISVILDLMPHNKFVSLSFTRNGQKIEMSASGRSVSGVLTPMIRVTADPDQCAEVFGKELKKLLPRPEEEPEADKKDVAAPPEEEPEEAVASVEEAEAAADVSREEESAPSTAVEAEVETETKPEAEADAEVFDEEEDDFE